MFTRYPNVYDFISGKISLSSAIYVFRATKMKFEIGFTSKILKYQIRHSDHPNAVMLNKRRQKILDRNRILISCLSRYRIQLCSTIDRPPPIFFCSLLFNIFTYVYQKWSSCTSFTKSHQSCAYYSYYFFALIFGVWDVHIGYVCVGSQMRFK